MMNLTRLNEKLKNIPNLTLKYFSEIESTNTEGVRLLEKNEIESNTLILTENQTNGRGRFQRNWISNSQDSLTFSLVLTDLNQLPPESIPMLALGAAVAAIDGVLNTTTIKPKVKWPNDILINRKKVGGILSEAVWNGTDLAGVVIGIGINIGKLSFPAEALLQYPANSLEHETGLKPEGDLLLIAILQSFFEWLPKLQDQSFYLRYQNDLAFMGESVNIFNEAGKQTITGVCSGITREGSLIVITKDNQPLICTAGEITIRPA